MPYTRQTERIPFEIPIRDIAENLAGPGDLTYVICRLMWTYWKSTGPSFKTWCLISKAVEEAVADFRDRHISVLNPDGYEKKKLEENGDVYY